ncbi:ATP-binding protein [Nostoc sp.]|uniref:ATP-binding protein n=1 Tax=Nostoc sp. TaxID=1180 RepID=UPI002FF57EE6
MITPSFTKTQLDDIDQQIEINKAVALSKFRLKKVEQRYFMDNLAKQQKIILLDKVFTPSRPVMTREFFFGRFNEINRIFSAINEEGKHIILYGERGVGKTSLANFMNTSTQFLATKVTCNRYDTFNTIWKRAFEEILMPLTNGEWEIDNVSSEQVSLLENLLYDNEEIESSPTVIRILKKVSIPILFIFDEFDLIEDNLTQIKFADTIKALSDNLPNITLLIVGIADNVNELIGNHNSIERCTTQVKLPTMPDDELEKIITQGLEKLELTIDSSVKSHIVELSQGFPHYTHLLTKHSSKNAIYNNSNLVNKDHFKIAVEDAINDSYESVKESYRKAVATVKKETDFRDIIFACASVETDEYGTFRLADLQNVLSELKQKPVKPQSYAYYIGKLCEADRGAILQRIGVKNKYRYRFQNPLVKVFVLLKNYKPITI